MAEINEKLLFHYLHNITYNQTANNVIGATTSTTLRTVASHSDVDTKYVKKFGNGYNITDITNGSIATPRSDGGGVNKWWYEFYDGDTHTLLATLKDENGASTFVDGSSVASASSYIYVKLVWKSGAVSTQNNDRITINTDIDPGGKNFRISAETITSGELLFYFADNSSTYYMESITDCCAKYGGYRVVQIGTEARPYYTIQDAIDAVQAAGAPFDKVVVLDSETYDEDIELDVSGISLLALLGETPTITRGVGARTTRNVEHDGNNSDTIYVSKDGDDGTGDGTFQNPYLTIQFAENNLGGRTYINIKDSETYNEIVTINVAVTIEPVYGETPTLTYTAGPTNDIIDVAALAAINLYGLTIDGANMADYGIWRTDRGNEYKDNTIFNAVLDGIGGTIVMLETYKRNRIYNNGQHGINMPINLGHVPTITENYIYNNGSSGINMVVNGDTIVMTNNLIYDNAADGLTITGGNLTGTIENNTIVSNNQYGININVTAFGGTFRDNIVYDNTTYDLYKGGGAAVSITESNYGTNSGWTIGAGNITTDPVFCKTSLPYKWGISSGSGAYRTDTSTDDMGVHLRIIEINQSSVEINGFNIDGQEFYNNGIFILDSVNHTGTNIKWCSIYDFQGIAVDLYDDDTNTDVTISNCKVYDNGDGIKFTYGGNTIQECLIYNNAINGIHSNYTGQIFNHNVFYGNQYGLYLETNTSGISIKNSIFNGNSLRGISSVNSNAITYCCITDAVDNIDITDTSNITDDPLFVDITSGSENFNIKTIEGRYIHNSPCKDSSDDSPVQDIGAYDVTRTVASERWLKYQLESNPRDMDIYDKIKKEIKIDNAVGDLKRYGETIKKVFPLKYSNDDYQTEEQIETLKYLALTIPGIDGLKEDACDILLHILPSQKLFSGTSATIDGTAKTIDDAAQTWNRNTFRGFWVGVKFTSGSDLVIDSTLKTGTKAGAGWTVDEWIGYYFYHNDYYYRILSNTATVLTFSDPDDTLISETASTYAIEKYFKILSNTKNQILVEDEDDDLVTGSYDYYIDFIKVVTTNKDFKPRQDGYYYQKYWQKTGFSVSFEEK
jgi:hypothetical protein